MTGTPPSEDLVPCPKCTGTELSPPDGVWELENTTEVTLTIGGKEVPFTGVRCMFLCAECRGSRKVTRTRAAEIMLGA